MTTRARTQASDPEHNQNLSWPFLECPSLEPGRRGRCFTNLGSAPRVDGPDRLTYKALRTFRLYEQMAMSGSNGHEKLTRIERLCTEHGLRMTGQRRTIARILSEARDHPDVEEVFRRAHAVDSRIALSTVYRTVNLLEKKGILERHEFGHGRARFEEAARGHHDHLIDLATGRVIEFKNEQIEAIQERVAAELGFRLVGHRLELYGVAIDVKKPQKPKQR